MESLRDILPEHIMANIAGTLFLMEPLRDWFFDRMIADVAGTPEVYHQCQVVWSTFLLYTGGVPFMLDECYTFFAEHRRCSINVRGLIQFPSASGFVSNLLNRLFFLCATLWFPLCPSWLKDYFLPQRTQRCSLRTLRASGIVFNTDGNKAVPSMITFSSKIQYLWYIQIDYQ